MVASLVLELGLQLDPVVVSGVVLINIASGAHAGIVSPDQEEAVFVLDNRRVPNGCRKVVP